MPTPTGTISLSDVNIELGLSSTATISMNDAAVRTLAGVGGSGTIITMDNLRGKSSLTFSPDGSTNSGNPTGIYNYGSSNTSATITASSAVTWNWTRNGSAGSASVANGGSASSITFSLSRSTAVYRLTYWSVSVTANGVTKYWTVELEVGTAP
jgi:hypothetical protein